MNKENLEIANALHEEIKELDNFLFIAERVWTGKMNIKEIIANAFGVFNSKEYNMNTKVKNKVLVVLKEHLKELQNKLENL